MNHKHKINIKRLFFSLILCGFVFMQNAELITQKINVENAIRDKVMVTINKLLDQSKYVIIVNARMDVKAFSMGNSTDNNTQASKNYYSPIPGLLPTVPQDIKEPVSNTFRYSTDKYLLYGLDIAIYLDESVANGALKQNISRLVNDAIPEIMDCEDCIRFETMSMSNSQSSTYQDLLDKIEQLEADRREAEQQITNWRFDQLEEQLIGSETARQEWEAQARQRERSRQMSDSIRLANLQKIETEYRKKQDSLYLVTSYKLDEAIRGRIESESDLNDKLIDIIKTGLDGNADKDLIGGGTDINRNSGGSGKTLLWIALGIIILFLGLLTMLIMKDKKPIYLKPKKTKNNSSSTNTTPDKVAETTGLDLSDTTANENDDVMRSELKSLRQSAVAMSVSQKEGANEIVKDWLESNDENNSNSNDDDNQSEDEQ